MGREERLVQAADIMTRRLFQHQTVQDIADDMGMSTVTVSRRLALARKEGIPQEARTIFIKEMLPAAMAVVLDTLKSPDEKLRLSAAKMIIDGLEAMRDPDDRGSSTPSTKPGDGDSYEVWRERIKVTKRAVDSARRPASAGLVIDASPIAPGDASPDATAGTASPLALPPGVPGPDTA